MENTNYFTIVLADLDGAEALGAAFENENDFFNSITKYFKSRKCDINLSETFGFDYYERNGLIINGCFTSGPTDVSDFLAPLAKFVKYMYAEIVDDEVCRSLRYGFCEGKRTSLQESLSRMMENFDIPSLGRAGQYIAAQNRLDEDKSYALRVALVNRKKTSVIKELLEQGADPNSRNNHGYSCLYLAIENKNAGAVSLLLEHGANIDSPSCTEGDAATYLVEACRFGSPKIVEALLKYGADPNIEDEFYEMPPIQMAISNHMSKSVKQLIEYGARTSVNLLKINSECFHSNHCGKLNEKLEIFKTLLSRPELKREFVENKHQYLSLLNMNFKNMYPEAKDKDDFNKMCEYLSGLSL